MLVVPPSLSVNTLAEFIAYTKARPGELQLCVARRRQRPTHGDRAVQSLTGVKMVHVPTAAAGGIVGAMTGQVQALFSTFCRCLA